MVNNDVGMIKFKIEIITLKMCIKEITFEVTLKVQNIKKNYTIIKENISTRYYR